MPKYLCLQRSLPGGEAGSEKPSPAQMQAMYAQFNAWREKFQANLVDLGGKLGAGRLTTAAPAPDGPLIEVKELVGGYAIFDVESEDEALDLATKFMDMHRVHWPAFEGECEMRPLEEEVQPS